MQSFRSLIYILAVFFNITLYISCGGNGALHSGDNNIVEYEELLGVESTNTDEPSSDESNGVVVGVSLKMDTSNQSTSPYQMVKKLFLKVESTSGELVVNSEAFGTTEGDETNSSYTKKVKLRVGYYNFTVIAYGELEITPGKNKEIEIGREIQNNVAVVAGINNEVKFNLIIKNLDSSTAQQPYTDISTIVNLTKSLTNIKIDRSRVTIHKGIKNESYLAFTSGALSITHNGTEICGSSSIPATIKSLKIRYSFSISLQIDIESAFVPESSDFCTGKIFLPSQKDLSEHRPDPVSSQLIYYFELEDETGGGAIIPDKYFISELYDYTLFLQELNSGR